MAQFEFRGLILEAQIRHWNLSIYHLQAVPLRDSLLCIRIVFFRSKKRQIAIERPLEFIVEKHADGSASAALDAVSLFLIEAVEIGVVFDFAGFPQAVVNGLTIGKLVRLFKEAMP